MSALGDTMADQNIPEAMPDAPLIPEQSTAARKADALQLKRAMAWAHTARFLDTASQLDQLPISELPEYAFVGRSNAGKSSAINALTQQRGLAFASKTPGRTQHINLRRVVSWLD